MFSHKTMSRYYNASKVDRLLRLPQKEDQMR